jgi:hypothetical protein
MRLNKNIFYKVIAAYMVLFFMLPSSGMGTIILCLSRDGHTAISLTNNKQCCDTDRATAQEHYDLLPAQASESPDCPPCVDIPVSVEHEHRHAQTAPHAGLLSKQLSSPAVCAPDVSRQLAALSERSNPVSSFKNPVYEAVRTVVLII